MVLSTLYVVTCCFTFINEEIQDPYKINLSIRPIRKKVIDRRL